MRAIFRMKLYVLQAFYWLREGKVAWLALLFGVVLLIGSVWLPLGIKRRLALDGTVFQMVGVGMSAFVISRLRRSFELDHLLQSFVQYLADARYIFVSRPPVSVTSAVKIENFVSVGKAVTYAPLTGTVEEKLAQVEEGLGRLRSSLDAVHSRVEEIERRFTTAITQETSARKTGLEKIDDKLREAMVGDWQFALVGLAYLFVGIVLGTVPGEIARTLLWLGLT